MLSEVSVTQPNTSPSMHVQGGIQHGGAVAVVFELPSLSAAGPGPAGWG